MSDLLIALLLMSGLGVLLSLGLALADRRLYVEFDPRIDTLAGMLPGTNCGVCGRPGCRAFAETILAGLSAPSACTVSGPADLKALSKVLGGEVGTTSRRVARLACAGGSNVARNRAVYRNVTSCRGAALIAGGGKGCVWGCLGLGDCEAICGLGAIRMNEHNLPVVDEARCTACNDCVEVCPKDLFSIHPTSHHLWVACKSLDEGDAALAECEQSRMWTISDGRGPIEQLVHALSACNPVLQACREVADRPQIARGKQQARHERHEIASCRDAA